MDHGCPLRWNPAALRSGLRDTQCSAGQHCSSGFHGCPLVLPLGAGRLQRNDDQGAEDSSRGRRSSGPQSPADPATPATRSTSLALSQEVHSRT